MMETPIAEQNPLMKDGHCGVDDNNMFESQLASKSAVKLIKNSKGINWEIKVVSGEEDIMSKLREIAVIQHRALEEEFD